VELVVSFGIYGLIAIERCEAHKGLMWRSFVVAHLATLATDLLTLARLYSDGGIESAKQQRLDNPTTNDLLIRRRE
jgi:hypothetical protein